MATKTSPTLHPAKSDPAPMELRKLGRSKKDSRNHVQISLRSMSQKSSNEITVASIKEIPGVDFLPKREPNSKPLFRLFYGDQIELLIEMARTARDRSRMGSVFISPVGENAFAIYRRKSATK